MHFLLVFTSLPSLILWSANARFQMRCFYADTSVNAILANSKHLYGSNTEDHLRPMFQLWFLYWKKPFFLRFDSQSRWTEGQVHLFHSTATSLNRFLGSIPQLAFTSAQWPQHNCMKPPKLAWQAAGHWSTVDTFVSVHFISGSTERTPRVPPQALIIAECTRIQKRTIRSSPVRMNTTPLRKFSYHKCRSAHRDSEVSTINRSFNINQYKIHSQICK